MVRYIMYYIPVGNLFYIAYILAFGVIFLDGILHGVETRTSAPVQITRDKISFESISLHGLFPVGEGRISLYF